MRIELDIYKWEDAPQNCKSLDTSDDKDYVVVIHDATEIDDTDWQLPKLVQEFLDYDEDYIWGWGNVTRHWKGNDLILIFAHS